MTETLYFSSRKFHPVPMDWSFDGGCYDDDAFLELDTSFENLLEKCSSLLEQPQLVSSSDHGILDLTPPQTTSGLVLSSIQPDDDCCSGAADFEPPCEDQIKATVVVPPDTVFSLSKSSAKLVSSEPERPHEDQIKLTVIRPPQPVFSMSNDSTKQVPSEADEPQRHKKTGDETTNKAMKKLKKRSLRRPRQELAKINGASSLLERKHKEGGGPALFECIRDNDVFCERGGRSNAHEGNRRYRTLIMEYRSEYQSTQTKREKIKLSQSLVDEIHSRGGRFLKKVVTPSGKSKYQEIPSVEARLKISQALRERKALKLTR